jgi:hypothetical protein
LFEFFGSLFEFVGGLFVFVGSLFVFVGGLFEFVGSLFAFEIRSFGFLVKGHCGASAALVKVTQRYTEIREIHRERKDERGKRKSM